MKQQLAVYLQQLSDDINVVIAKIARRLIRKVVEIIFTDIDLLRLLGDPYGSSAFEREKLGSAAKLKSRPALLEYCVKQASIPNGLHLEFGVFKGASINRLANIKPDIVFYGFDSFVGLPEAWNMGAPRGAFSLKGELPPVRKNVKLIKGFYDDTLPSFVNNNAGRSIAFMHIDCDLYSSTKTVLRLTKELMRDGTIILLDEFFNFPDWRNRGEFKAFAEFIEESKFEFEYLAYIRHGVQMGVRIKTQRS
jgi:hypothetical protein